MDQKMAMMQQHGIPFLVQRLVLLPAIRKDTRTYVHAYMQLVAGEVLPLKTSKQQKRGLASCFAA